MFACTLCYIGDRSLAAMGVVGETLNNSVGVRSNNVSDVMSTYCTLGNMEVVEQEERCQVSQLRGAYRAANKCACSLPEMHSVEYVNAKNGRSKYLCGLLCENAVDHDPRYGGHRDCRKEECMSIGEVN